MATPNALAASTEQPSLPGARSIYSDATTVSRKRTITPTPSATVTATATATPTTTVATPSVESAPTVTAPVKLSARIVAANLKHLKPAFASSENTQDAMAAVVYAATLSENVFAKLQASNLIDGHVSNLAAITEVVANVMPTWGARTDLFDLNADSELIVNLLTTLDTQATLISRKALKPWNASISPETFGATQIIVRSAALSAISELAVAKKVSQDEVQLIVQTIDELSSSAVRAQFDLPPSIPGEQLNNQTAVYLQATASAAADLLKGILNRETDVSVAVDELRTVFRYMFSVALYGNEKELTSTSLAAPIYVGEAPKASVPDQPKTPKAPKAQTKQKTEVNSEVNSIPVLQPVDAPTAAPLVAGVTMEMEATEVPEIVPEAAPKTSANPPTATAATVRRRRII